MIDEERGADASATTHVEKCDRERDERVRVVDLSALERPMRNKIGPTECCTMRQRTTASRDNGSP